MRRKMVFRLTGSLIVAGVAVIATHAAQAREITDYEAGKLTFDALTATPVYHRPIVHHVAYRTVNAHAKTSHRMLAAANTTHTVSRRALVHTVVYHPKASSAHHHTRSRG